MCYVAPICGSVRQFEHSASIVPSDIGHPRQKQVITSPCPSPSVQVLQATRPRRRFHCETIPSFHETESL